MMKTIIIRGVLSVGCHHYGLQQLKVGDGYVVEPDFTCPFDKNAMSIHDMNTKRKVAYLSRKCAFVLSFLFRENLIQGKMLLKPKEPAEVRTQRVGPQQICNVGLKVQDEAAADVIDRIKFHGLTAVIGH